MTPVHAAVANGEVVEGEEDGAGGSGAAASMGSGIEEVRRGLLFPDVTPAQVTVAFVRACDKAAIADFSFHDLRHTYASHQRMRGADLHDLQKLLGHSDPRMTNRYAHLSNEHLGNAARRLDGCYRCQRKAANSIESLRTSCHAGEAPGAEPSREHVARRRHTYASHALMAGMTIEVLAQQLRHKDTRITMRHYAHLCPQSKQESGRRNAPSFGFASAPASPRCPVLVRRAND
jgi:hypothetical protein